ncbi:MAG: hypothetical protein WCW33_04735 [Candidatus Babeliales bacterium]
MLAPADGVLAGYKIRLYNFVLEKMKQHLVRHNFCEVAMPVHALVGRQQGIHKIFMHGPLVNEQIPADGDWLQVSSCVIEQTCSDSLVAYAHFLKILDSFFHKMGAEDYLLMLWFSPSVPESDKVAVCDLLAIVSINHVLGRSDSRSLGVAALVFEFVSCRSSRERLCHGTVCVTNGCAVLHASIAMMSVVNFIGHTAHKLLVDVDRLVHLVVPMTNHQVPEALLLVHELHGHNLAADIFLADGSQIDHLVHARSCGARYVVMIGPDEQLAGTARIQDVLKGTSHVIVQREVVHFLGCLSTTSND